MSMNLHLSGKREVTVNKTGAVSNQTIDFNLYQTPTTVTRAALASGDPKGAYVIYVKSVSKDVQEPVYAEDDIFCESDPIGFEIHNAGNDHLKELEEFLVMCDSEGYTVEFYEL